MLSYNSACTDNFIFLCMQLTNHFKYSEYFMCTSSINVILLIKAFLKSNLIYN